MESVPSKRKYVAFNIIPPWPSFSITTELWHICCDQGRTTRFSRENVLPDSKISSAIFLFGKTSENRVIVEVVHFKVLASKAILQIISPYTDIHGYKLYRVKIKEL